MSESARTPFPWFGGKVAMVPTFLALLPAHTCYVEVFGGAAALLFSKKPSRIEVYNDLDSGLVNFFRVLRNPEHAGALAQLLDLTPYSREEWNECLQTWQDALDPIEQARRWFVVVQQAFSGHFDGAGWRYVKNPSHNPAKSYRSAIAQLPRFTKRLAEVQIEHADFEQVLRAYDSKETCFYLDPPYLPSTRRAHGYRHEMTEDDHQRLLDAVQGLQGKVMLSGYDAPLYQNALKGWHRLEQQVTCHAVGRTRATGAQGPGSIIDLEQTRIESIWLSPNIAQQPTLWAV